MRPYDWFRYGEAEKARFVIKPKYSAIINLKGKRLDQIMALARSSRRREIRYAKEREGLRLFDGASIEDLADLYKKTFAKQGVLIKDKEMDLIKKIGDYYLSECSGKIIAIENEMGYLVAGGIVFKDYDNTWHVPIVGVGDTQYGGTLLYYNIIILYFTATQTRHTA